MKSNQSSTTAEFMALFRAEESSLAAHKRLFNDPFAACFLGQRLRLICGLFRVPLLRSLLARLIDVRWPGARTSGIARTRLIDDWANAAVAAGAEQVLVLGAGFDSRAWRLPAFGDLAVFEVDHPATSAVKQRRIAELGALTSRVTFVPIDFDRERLSDKLSNAGFQGNRRTLVLWEGVTNYLTAEAVDATLRWVGALAEGSRLIFTYVDAGVLDGSKRFQDAARPRLAVASAGEPWTFGFAPEQLPHYLKARGLQLIEDLDANEYRRMTMGRSAARARGYEFYHVALAQVEGQVSCK
jgi:methyltransferase (TIGR00027 family)